MAFVPLFYVILFSLGSILLFILGTEIKAPIARARLRPVKFGQIFVISEIFVIKVAC